ncbi:MAG: prepilin peptidase [Pacificimonas sp.]
MQTVIIFPTGYWGALAVLAGLLLYTIFSDVRARRIPNWLNLAIAALAVLYWASQDVSYLAVFKEQLLLAGCVGLFFGLFWLRGWLGGGDLKMHIALALWLPLRPLIEMMLWMSIFGVVLTVIVFIEHKWWNREGRIRAPYGVAISFAAFLILGEPIVNRFAA